GPGAVAAALQLPAARRRGHSRVLSAALARQGGTGGRAVGHRRLQQPGPAEPVVQPGGQPVHPRSGLQPAAQPASAGLGQRAVQAGHPGTHGPWLLVAGTADLRLLPRHPSFSAYCRLVPGAPPAFALRAAGSRNPGWLSRGQDLMDRKRWQTWAKRLFTLLFLILVPALLYLLVRNLDWNEVRHS